ncbi:MAG TPA: hypothetical protein VE545_08155, partial [Candidatus Dormibacteraeota bacterium]|nr:hypothetical protein [Candidatus Dormibacteraeota bacterium]
TLKTRRTATVAVWALGTAALVAGAVSWTNWRARQLPLQQNSVQTVAQIQGSSDSNDSSESTLVADNQENEFTAVPGAIYNANDDAEIVRVRMQRSSLGALGLPVNEDRANEWVQVDLLVGSDGLPQAVRATE